MAFTALLGVYYWEVIFKGHVVSGADLVFSLYRPWLLDRPVGFEPSNLALLDSVVSFGPAMTFVRESLASSQLPLWNPYTEFGMPFFAQSQWGMLSPVQLPFMLPPSLYSLVVAQTATGIVKLAVAGSGCYLLGRRLRLTRPAAMFAAVAFMFGGYVTVWLSMPATSTVVFLPWILLGVEAVLTGTRPLWAASGLALASAAAIAGGHPELVTFTVIGVTGYTVWRLWLLWRDPLRDSDKRRADARGAPRCPAQKLGALLLAVVLAGCLSAVILVPATELLALSGDVEERYGPDSPGLPWANLRHVLDPGAPATPDKRLAPLHRAPWYVGAMTLPFAALALALRDRRVVGLTIVAAIGLLIATNALPYRELSRVIRPLAGVGYGNATFLWSFGLAMLSGVGVDRLQRLLSRRRPGHWSAPAAACGLCLMLFVELFAWGANYNSRVPRREATVPMPQQLRVTRSGPDAPRILYVGYGVVRPLLSMLFQRPDVGGYGQPTRRDWEQFMDRMVEGLELGADYRLRPRRGGLKILTAANVGYVATSPPDPPPTGLRQLRGGSLGVWAADDPLPRAYVVHSAQSLPRRKKLLRRLTKAQFDPRREVLLDEPSPLPPTTGRAPRPSASSARLITYENNEVVVKTSTTKPGLLVLSDSHYPGWKADVDGRPSHIYRANGLFRAVELAPGRHTVSFSYEPESVRLGALVSLAGLVLLVGVGLLGRRHAIPPHHPPWNALSTDDSEK